MADERRAILRSETVMSQNNNFADGILQAMNMLQTDDFVQSIVTDKNTTPSIILYLKQQIDFIRQLCFSRPHGSVLAFDTTFNLTKGLYATVSVFKNPCLLRKTTGDEPIFVGPVFLHGRLTADSYATFFEHLSRVFRGCDFRQLVVGSDDSAAL
jgi:hypothetical protein